MGCGDETKRIILKTSTVAGEKPTVPTDPDHRSGTWLKTDIYKGELFFNKPDGKLYTRGDNGIEDVVTSASDGEVVYRARVWQTGTDPLTLDEIHNPKNFTLTSTKFGAGLFEITGFTGESFSTTGNFYDLTISDQALPIGETVLASFPNDTELRINTYDNTDTVSDGILKKTIFGSERYYILTIKKY